MKWIECDHKNHIAKHVNVLNNNLMKKNKKLRRTQAGANNT